MTELRHNGIIQAVHFSPGFGVCRGVVGESSACFSPCMTYRYKLARRWGAGTRYCNFIMLNPSTADERYNDPTVERCERRAREWGYDGLAVTNLFALRSTDPAALRKAEDPMGAENLAAIHEVAAACDLVVCAWGVHGSYLGRGSMVRQFLLAANIQPHYLKLSKTGNPMHPLYLPYSLKPKRWI